MRASFRGQILAPIWVPSLGAPGRILARAALDFGRPAAFARAAPPGAGRRQVEGARVAPACVAPPPAPLAISPRDWQKRRRGDRRPARFPSYAGCFARAEQPLRRGGLPDLPVLQLAPSEQVHILRVFLRVCEAAHPPGAMWEMMTSTLVWHMCAHQVTLIGKIFSPRTDQNQNL